uniref:Uncharacterized protein n=1 Tax=viral metagenome TaxID=1070528 RepID=A0A6C0KWQ7_9ZZZZ
MSAVTSSNAASGAVTGTPRRTYVTINAFNGYFYTYTTSTDFTGGQFVTTGSLGSVSGANATTCPAGRVLRENGKRLYPGVNPGVTSMLVGVFDDKTFLNGFIDPNAKVFQTQNNDIATSYPDQVDADNTETRDLGNGVYTRGDLRAEGILDLSGSAIIGNDLIVDNDSYLKGDVTHYQSTFVHAPIRIGNAGSYITKIKAGTVTFDAPNVGARNVQAVEVTVAAFNPATDTIHFNIAAGLDGGLALGGAYLKPATTTTAVLRIINYTNSDINPGPLTFTYTLINYSTV